MHDRLISVVFLFQDSRRKDLESEATKTITHLVVVLRLGLLDVLLIHRRGLVRVLRETFVVVVVEARLRGGEEHTLLLMR